MWEQTIEQGLNRESSKYIAFVIHPNVVSNQNYFTQLIREGFLNCKAYIVVVLL